MSSRQERKLARAKLWKDHVDEREKFRREHPVLSGAVKIVDYVEPKWRYVRPAPIKNGLDMGI